MSVCVLAVAGFVRLAKSILLLFYYCSMHGEKDTGVEIKKVDDGCLRVSHGTVFEYADANYTLFGRSTETSGAPKLETIILKSADIERKMCTPPLATNTVILKKGR
jgi:hypothetical protein